MTDDIIYLGEDLGMGANKLYGSQGGLQIPSQVAADSHQEFGAILGLKHRQRPLHVETEAGSFFVGEGAHDFGRPIENLDFDRLTGSPEIKVILYGSLTRYALQYGPISGPIVMMTGLPLQTLSGPEKRANKDALKAWMRGSHRWKSDGIEYSIEISAVDATPQPVGTLFDYLLDEKGQFIPERKVGKREVGIVSIGFNTIELLVVRGFELVEKFTAGQTAGVRRLLELVNREGLYSLGEMDAALRLGRLDYSEALPIWTREVQGEIEKCWGAARKRFSFVLLAGGGAILLRDQLADYFAGKALLPDDPVISTARGLYKLVLLKR